MRDTITVTFFDDYAAKVKHEEAITLFDLEERIWEAHADSKSSLPWLKLATFGDMRSVNNSLRHDKNLLSITGIEGDYDEGKISIAEARGILEDANLSFLIYTSPSHTQAFPRWRVLCPLSRPHNPTDHKQLVDRLNGVLGGILDDCSWTLSQGYYFGSVAGGDHQAIFSGGEYIDAMPHLDAGAIGKPVAITEKKYNGSNGADNDAHLVSYVPARYNEEIQADPIYRKRLDHWLQSTTQGFVRQLIEGKKHTSLVRFSVAIGGHQAAAGWTDAYLVEQLQGALPDTVKDWGRARKDILDGLRMGRDRPLPPLQDRERPSLNGGSAPSYRLLQQPTVARQGGPDAASPGGQKAREEALQENPYKKPPKLIKLYTLSEIRELPDPEWLVEGIIPEKSMIVPYGQPKAGKSFIVMSIGIHVAAGKPWFGLPVKQGGVVYIVGEASGRTKDRSQGMQSEYGIEDDTPFWIITHATNFRNEEEVDSLIYSIHTTIRESRYSNMPVAMVIVDTLARAMPGADENSAQDVGLVISATDKVREALGCAAVIIHHEGKDEGRGARGTSALRGAWDTGINVKNIGPDPMKLEIAQMQIVDQRDAEAGGIMTFDMKKVPVGIGHDTLVPILRESDEKTKGKEKKKYPAGQTGMALKILKQTIANDGSIIPALRDFPPDTLGVQAEVFRLALYGSMLGEKQPAKQRAFHRAVSNLQQGGWIVCRDPWVWIVEDVKPEEEGLM